jgi:3alpha(or 20beta)-hydroxysteroid dehydrogenase
MDSQMDNRVALVTGGAGGIGGATARLMIQRGGRVVIADVRADEGRTLADELGEAAHFEELDITSEEGWARAVAGSLSAFGHLDVLVNNAGVFGLGSLENTTRESFEKMITVNQIGCFLGMKAVLAPMRDAGGGAIVNTLSAAALVGNPGLFSYTATKWALRGMTKTAAAELGRYGIRVNAVLPGSIDTDMVRAMKTEGREAFYAALPVPRQGQAIDVAEMICFLASDSSAYCTGAEFVVDGGLSAAANNPPRSTSG